MSKNPDQTCKRILVTFLFFFTREEKKMTSASELYTIVAAQQILDPDDIELYTQVVKLVEPMLASTNSKPLQQNIFEMHRKIIESGLTNEGVDPTNAAEISSAIMLGGPTSTAIIALANVPLCMLFWGLLEVNTKFLREIKQSNLPEQKRTECPRHLIRIGVINTQTLQKQIKTHKQSVWVTALRFGPWCTHNEATTACRKFNETFVTSKQNKINTTLKKIDDAGCIIYCNETVFQELVEKLGTYK